MKKITLLDIADACHVSRVTVWKALSNRPGVSKALRSRIIETALRMDYPLKLEEEEQSSYLSVTLPRRPPNAVLQQQIHIALVVSRPETSMFWGRIITNISEYLKNLNTKLIFICLPVNCTEEYVLPDELTDDSIKGMIVMNIYEPLLFKMLNALFIPKVFLDSVTDFDFQKINGDLFLIEGRSTVETIVRHALEQGIRTVGFIGDIKYAQTNYERYLGFCSALHNNNVPIIPEYCLTKSFGMDSYQYEINEFLESLPTMPEMFVCASDYIAQLTIQHLTLMNYEIPRDIMISGFDDNFEFSHTNEITTVHVQNSNMGVRLAEQILYRTQHPDADYEITYIRSKVVFRGSTDRRQ